MQKLSVQQLPNIFKELVKVDYDSSTNTLTFTNVNGYVLDVVISSGDGVTDVVYDSDFHVLAVTYSDGHTDSLDISDLYNIYIGVDDTQITVDVSADNKIKATIKNASISRDKFASDVTNELDKDREDIDALKKALENQSDLDSSALGDVAVLPLIDKAFMTWQLVQVGSADADFKDENAGGWIFSGAEYLTKNRPFNRIKVNVITPGWLRIGIARGTGTNEYDGVARGFCKAGCKYTSTDVYPVSLIPGNDGSDTTADGQAHTMLKKWLVVQWIASPGLHEFDIPMETVTSPLEQIFCECRTGYSGFAMNRSGATVTVNGLSVSNNTIPYGGSWPTSYVSKTTFNSGQYAVSNNMLDASAAITWSDSINGGVVNSGWMGVSCLNTTDQKFLYNEQSPGGLNIGLYKRGPSGTIAFAPVIENVISKSTTSALNINNCCALWFSDYEGQQVLAEKRSRIYAIELIVTTPGDLSVYLMNTTDISDATKSNVLKVWTLRIRGIGRQVIHLPEEVILQPGQFLAFGGLTEAAFVNKPAASTVGTTSTINRGYGDTVVFAHCNGTISSLCNNFTAIGDDATGVTNVLPYCGLTESYATTGFSYYTGVKYIGGTKFVDFSSATVVSLPDSYLNISLIIRSGRHSKLEDLNISITGDSISSYSGIVSRKTDFGGVTNAAGNNAYFYPDYASGLVNSPDQTWWGVLIKNNRARLLRNDAWSGCQVGGTDSTTSSSACASDVRTRMLYCNTYNHTANTTTGLAHPYGWPEVIFCLVGTNDLAGNRAAGAYSNTAPSDLSTILGAFEVMVARHRTYYPNAKCVYFMLPRGSNYPYPYVNSNSYSIAQMAEGMEYIANALGAYFVPLSYFEDLNQPENSSKVLWTPTGYAHPRASGSNWGSTDRLHPNILGNQLIANALTRFVESHF